MRIYTRNEYDSLRSVIVGHAEMANWPTGDIFFDRIMSLSTYKPVLKKGKVPEEVIQETRDDVYAFIDILKSNGVKVYRPEHIDWSRTVAGLNHVTSGMHCYSARDLLLTVGNMIIECPSPYVSRHHEVEAYESIKVEAIKDGCRWIAAPRPRMKASHCRTLIGKIQLTEDYPIFDAANVMKFQDKLLYLISGTGNYAGAKWLQKVVGNEFEVITWDGIYSFAHIDSTISSLNRDTILVNAERVNTLDKIPSFLRGHKRIMVENCAERKFHKFPYASKWIGMNVFSINPETVIVDPIQTDLIKKLKENKFKVITSQLRHSRTLGGGHHCITCDLERES